MQHASHSLISDLAALSLVSNLTRYPFSISAELLTFVRKKKKSTRGAARGEKVRGLVIYRASGPVFLDSSVSSHAFIFPKFQSNWLYDMCLNNFIYKLKCMVISKVLNRRKYIFKV